jgi:polyhydroxyalkanoate synthase
MQNGFVAMRPTGPIAKSVTFADKALDPKARESFLALEEWASDNVPFPGAAYVTYIRDLYQENLLVQAKHWARGRRVDLSKITCPLLTVVASKDAICPPPAALGLKEAARSTDTEVLTAPGGHVGAVVGAKAVTHLYPQMTKWFASRLEATAPN